MILLLVVAALLTLAIVASQHIATQWLRFVFVFVLVFLALVLLKLGTGQLLVELQQVSLTGG